jgi:polyhydroxyalkanoate synthesis regulator phasin
MGLGNLVQKAVYLGIGVATYAGEKAGERLNDLRDQMQKMADEMVERGEMTAEEGRKFVDDMVKKAQQPSSQPGPSSGSTGSTSSAPRPIEILDEQENPTPQPSEPTAPTPTAATTNPTPRPNPVDSDIDIDTMRRQVQELQEELRRLRKL